MMAKSKAKKRRIDDIGAFLEREDDSESDYSLTEIESDQESSSCGEYESCDEQSDLESSDILPQNISPDTEEYHFQWTKWDSDQAGDGSGKPLFTGVAGVCVPMISNVSPLQCFELFFTDDFVHHVVVETNRYANKCREDAINSGVGSNARIRLWNDVCDKEIRLFIALILAMGIISKPELKLYWTRDHILQTPIFHETFSLKRFQLILRYLHFVSDEDADNTDRLRKIRPLLEMLRISFRNTYMPEQNISVDESLMLFKGRSLMKQYIPLKRSRFGIKIFFLCESQSGYAWDFFIYTGQGEERRGVESASQKLISHAAVTKLVLCPELRGKGYVVFMDRWFSSPLLFRELQHHGFGACGTVDLRRKEMPKELRTAKLKKGDVLCYTSGVYSAIKWHDKKDVTMLSTYHRGRVCETTKIDWKTKEALKKPEAVTEYNANMGGVDRLDQKIKPYECLRKSVRWYRKLFFHLMDITVVNAHIVYGKSGREKCTLLQFRHEVIRGLLEKYAIKRKAVKGGRPSKTDPPVRLTERHFPTHIPATEKKKFPSRVCRVCPGRKETRWECKQCGNIPLHPENCFETYHTKRKY